MGRAPRRAAHVGHVPSRSVTHVVTYSRLVDLTWIARQFRALPERGSPFLLRVVLAVVVSAVVTALLSQVGWPVGFLAGLVAMGLVSLYVFDACDDQVESAVADANARNAAAATEASDNAATERQIEQARHDLQVEDLETTFDLRRREYDAKIQILTEERDGLLRAAETKQTWIDGVMEQARADKEEAQREREAALGEARSAIDEAKRIEGRAELLVAQAHEIARESGRAKLPPPPPPSS